MKRVIKFHNIYKSDEGKFSTCSTKYNILPILVEDNAGPAKLLEIAKSLDLKTISEAINKENNEEYVRSLVITDYVALNETVKKKGLMHDNEEFQVYLGFITMPKSDTLRPVENINKGVTKEQASLIVNYQEFGVQDIGEIEEKPMVVMSGWQYFHIMPLLGYSLKSFEKRFNVKDENRHFHDSVDRCGECGTWDYVDDGYTYNFRELNGDLLGVNCGCFNEACKYNLDEFVNNTKNAIEKEVCEELEKEGKVQFLERFIGGMTDGRGGYYDGKSTREGKPESVLKEYQNKFPKAKFVFTHDESGQFQTYFSIWKVKSTNQGRLRGRYR